MEATFHYQNLTADGMFLGRSSLLRSCYNYIQSLKKNLETFCIPFPCIQKLIFQLFSCLIKTQNEIYFVGIGEAYKQLEQESSSWARHWNRTEQRASEADGGHEVGERGTRPRHQGLCGRGDGDVVNVRINVSVFVILLLVSTCMFCVY